MEDDMVQKTKKTKKTKKTMVMKSAHVEGPRANLTQNE
jgi:hypothetical protein